MNIFVTSTHAICDHQLRNDHSARAGQPKATKNKQPSITARLFFGCSANFFGWCHSNVCSDDTRLCGGVHLVYAWCASRVCGVACISCACRPAHIFVVRVVTFCSSGARVCGVRGVCVLGVSRDTFWSSGWALFGVRGHHFLVHLGAFGCRGTPQNGCPGVPFSCGFGRVF